MAKNEAPRLQVVMPNHPQRASKLHALIKTLRPQWQISVWREEQTQDADAVLAWQPSPASFSAMPSLKFIQNLGAGVDGLLQVPELPDVPLARFMSHSLATDMVDYVLWAMLSHQFNAPALHGAQQQRHWDADIRQDRTRPEEVLVLGAGRVGCELARRLSELSYRVTLYRRHAIPVENCEVITDYEELLTAAQQSDVVVNVLPLTTQTTCILNWKLFSAFKRKPLLIHVGRGLQLVEADLLAALDAGDLSAAVLDVFATEPLPAEHSFWQHPTITVTPHIAALSSLTEVAELTVQNTERVLSGKEPFFAVSRLQGY